MKRYIKSSESHQSNLSFDFSWRGDTYDEFAVLDVAEAALSPFECLGSQFLSMTEQYDGYDTMYENVSQCNITFEHDGYYNPDKIERSIAHNLETLGMCLERIDFQSID